MYVVTGGAGFIGSAIIAKLNAEGVDDILVVDNLGEGNKWLNLRGLKFDDLVGPDEFLEGVALDRWTDDITAIVHMGACSATTERDVDFLMENNYRYSVQLAEYAAAHAMRYIYASSAATYGSGEQGFDDDPERIGSLRPINPYGFSKQIADQWLLRRGYQEHCVGLKFFNVFGPNEYHKDFQRSTVVKAFEQLKAQGEIKLFRSAHPNYGDGEQRRDFVYVKDVLDPIWWLLEHPEVNGIFNMGTGKARTFADLARAVCAALGQPASISFIDMPEALKGQYQYFTEATMERLAAKGCPLRFQSLEESVKDYVVGHLQAADPYLTAAQVQY